MACVLAGQHFSKTKCIVRDLDMGTELNLIGEIKLKRPIDGKLDRILDRRGDKIRVEGDQVSVSAEEEAQCPIERVFDQWEGDIDGIPRGCILT